MKGKKIPILFYHKIDYPDPRARVKGLYVTPENFYRQMRYLKWRRFNTITAAEYIDYLEKGDPLPPRPILLTFDDGYRDNYLNAFPILKKFGFTATIFLVVGDVGEKVRWEDSEEQLEAEILTWEEIKEMKEYGIDFQSHTLTHARLTKLSPEKIEEELYRSRKILEDKLSSSVTSLAYPYGSFNEEIKKIAQKSGYKGAFTTLRGEGFDLYGIKRIGVKYHHRLWRFIRFVEWKYKKI